MSLLQIISKVIERRVQDQTNASLSENNTSYDFICMISNLYLDQIIEQIYVCHI